MAIDVIETPQKTFVKIVAKGPRGATGDVTPEALAAKEAAEQAATTAGEEAGAAATAASTATGAADTASDKALEAAQSAAEASTAAQVKVDELKDDLADPSKGAAMVEFMLPYTASISRSLASRAPEMVSVSDFLGDATSQFQNALLAAGEYGRSLFVPKLDGGLKYTIGENLIVPDGMSVYGGGSGSGSDRQTPGTTMRFEDCSLVVADRAGVVLENMRVERVGTTPGAAINCDSSGTGLARNFFNNVSVVGSNDIGVKMSGGWLFTWINPYIRMCRLGLVVTTGAFTTGMNSITLVGGEIQANTEAGIVLARCKQFNLVGTAIEGNLGVGIGLGNSPTSINILGYFEANQGGHIGPYSYEGASAGLAQCLNIQGGSYFLRGSGSTQPGAGTPAIEITSCRQFHMEPGVLMVGYASQTDKLIRLADAGDSNRAFGSISGIQTDCSEDLVLQNDCFVFGDEQIKTTGVNAVLADDANSTVHIAVFKEASTVKNPSKYASAFYNLQVVGAGDVVLSTRRYDKSGVQIGSAITQTSSVAAGFNQIPVSVPNSEDLAYITVFRAGGSASDTATGVTLISIDVREYTNKVKTI